MRETEIHTKDTIKPRETKQACNLSIFTKHHYSTKKKNFTDRIALTKNGLDRSSSLALSLFISTFGTRVNGIIMNQGPLNSAARP